MANYDTCFGYDFGYPLLYGPPVDDLDRLPTLDEPAYSGEKGKWLKVEFDYETELYRVDDNRNSAIAYIEDTDFSELVRFAKENGYDDIEIAV